jgi:hypothetical protein
MTEEQVRSLVLRRARPFAGRAGSTGVRAWAEAHGILTGHVSEFLSGKRGPATKMLNALGLEYRIVRKRKA